MLLAPYIPLTFKLLVAENEKMFSFEEYLQRQSIQQFKVKSCFLMTVFNITTPYFNLRTTYSWRSSFMELKSFTIQN